MKPHSGYEKLKLNDERRGNVIRLSACQRKSDDSANPPETKDRRISGLENIPEMRIGEVAFRLYKHISRFCQKFHKKDYFSLDK
jgi:hypothetical protein